MSVDTEPRTAEQPEEGWGVIRPGDCKAHYYRGSFSLCRRVGFYFGEKDPDNGRSRDDCAACRKVLDREAAKRPAQAAERDPRCVCPDTWNVHEGGHSIGCPADSKDCPKCGHPMMKGPLQSRNRMVDWWCANCHHAIASEEEAP